MKLRTDFRKLLGMLDRLPVDQIDPQQAVAVSQDGHHTLQNPANLVFLEVHAHAFPGDEDRNVGIELFGQAPERAASFAGRLGFDMRVTPFGSGGSIEPAGGIARPAWWGNPTHKCAFPPAAAGGRAACPSQRLRSRYRARPMRRNSQVAASRCQVRAAIMPPSCGERSQKRLARASRAGPPFVPRICRRNSCPFSLARTPAISSADDVSFNS